MNPKITIWLLGTFFLTTVSFANAQQPVRVPRMGWLTGSSLSGNPERRDALRQDLRELGYVEGKNIVIE